MSLEVRGNNGSSSYGFEAVSGVNNELSRKRCLERYEGFLEGFRDSSDDEQEGYGPTEDTRYEVFVSQILNASRSENSYEAGELLDQLQKLNINRSCDVEMGQKGSAVFERSERVKDVALGLELLNACKRGNRSEAERLLAKINSFYPLKMKDENGKSIFYYARVNGTMSGFVPKVKDKIISQFIDTCKKANSPELWDMYDFMGHEHVLKYMNSGKYTLEQRTLIKEKMILKLLDAYKKDDKGEFALIHQHLGCDGVMSHDHSKYTPEQRLLLIKLFAR